MQGKREAVARRIFDSGAFLDRSKSERGEGFRLKLHEKKPEAPLSPIYLNLRTADNPKPGPLTREIVYLIASTMLDMVSGDLEEGGKALEWDLVAGIPNAGDPFAEAFVDLADQQDRLLKLGKAEGGGKRRISGIVSGEYKPGQRVLLIDDLITGADSKLEAIAVLEAAGLVVQHVVLILDREGGGVPELQGRGYEVHSFFTLTQLIDLYRDLGLISEDMASEIFEYLMP